MVERGPRATAGAIVLLLVLGLGGLPSPHLARAQLSVTASENALRQLSPEARSAVLRADSVLETRTRRTDFGRVDVRTGRIRADYRPARLARPPADPEAAARQLLSERAERFGLTPALEGLALERRTHSPGGTHLLFRQQVDGVPVYRSTVKVNLDRRRQPVSVFNGLKLEESVRARLAPGAPGLSRREARDRVERAISPRGARSADPELVVYPSDPPRLAWRVVAWPHGVSAEWVMLIDARDGSFLRGLDATVRHRGSADHVERGVREAELGEAGVGASRSRRTGSSTSTERGTQSSSGTGLAFNPDPVTSSGAGSYGGSYVDADDASLPALERERTLVPLEGLSRDGDGDYVLQNEIVRITSESPVGHSFRIPREAHPDSFRYSRADDRFEAVNAYYHAYRGLSRVVEIDPDFAGRTAPTLRLSPHGEGEIDNSFYYPNDRLISFGDGGVDDAEDANIVWHELGHVLLDRAAPGLLTDLATSGGWSEGRAFHEGWSDYWTASFRRSLQAVYEEHTVDWRELFPWDGNNPFWSGRRIVDRGTYPRALTRDNLYADGLLWAETAMDVFSELQARYGLSQGRGVSDRLHLQSHAFLSSESFSMRDAARSLLTADLQLYGGSHRRMLIEQLGAGGFVDPSRFGPEVTFDPGRDARVEDGRLAVSATVRSRGFGVRDARAHYRRFEESGTYGTVELAPAEDDRYTGSAPLEDGHGLAAFYLSATDTLGVERTVPTAGPARPYLVPLGTSRTEDLLASARPTGSWQSDTTGWTVDGTSPAGAVELGTPRSDLVLAPARIASNDDVRSYFVLLHDFRAGSSSTGLVELSADGGRTWQVIDPIGGYGPPGETDEASSPESGFQPTGRPGVDQHVFDLSAWAGRDVRLRLVFASEEELGSDRYWTIHRGRVVQSTSAPSLELEPALTVHPNFPEPFSTSSTVHVTVPRAGRVRVEVYDALGRRVAVLHDGDREAGTFGLTFGRSSWSSGPYFLRVRANDRQRIEPFTVIR